MYKLNVKYTWKHNCLLLLLLFCFLVFVFLFDC